jgi:hypothetical protein
MRQTALALVCAAVFGGALLNAAGGGLPALAGTTTTGWRGYVQATEARRRAEATRAAGFLAADFDPAGVRDRATALGGGVAIARMQARGPAGASIDVPGAAVHHWRGVVLIPNTTLDAVMRRVGDGTAVGRQEDVLEARVLERNGSRLRVFLKVQRRKIVTVTYNTEHDVVVERITPARGASTSVATRIAELADVGTASEHEVTAGEDRGFLWRLNAYWRYEQVDGGVLAECESITLSRPVPWVVRSLVNPLVEGAARESMERTLIGLRDRLRG